MLRARLRAPVHARVRAWVCVCVHGCVGACVGAPTHICTHAQTHPHPRVCMFVCVWIFCCWQLKSHAAMGGPPAPIVSYTIATQRCVACLLSGLLLRRIPRLAASQCAPEARNHAMLLRHGAPLATAVFIAMACPAKQCVHT